MAFLRSDLGRAVALLGTVALGLTTLHACSAGGDSIEGAGGGGSSGSGGSGGGSATGGGGPILDSSVGDGNLEEAGVCAGESYPGKLAPLDVYVLLDATGSMNGSDDSPVVWPSVTSALISIASDPLLVGIGLGLTYLPVPPPDGFVIPGSCANNCVGQGTCKFIGIAWACNQACQTAEDCGLYGPCLPVFQERYCNGALVPSVSCDPLDYGQPVVPIAELPGNKDAFIQAINAKDPDGDATPTQPSLEGTLVYAHQWAVDHPTHLVHVLFATDGLPNNCTYNTIDGAATAAATAFNGNPSVPTFVLGIGDLGDLNQIATAGGTGQAYIADGSSVAGKMADVFNEIRAAGACKFQIPKPAGNQVPDYDRVNVYYTPLGQTEKIAVPYVGSEAACDPVQGGWYYDDPTKANPTKIILCPATCSGVQLSIEGVEVILGCKTILK